LFTFAAPAPAAAASPAGEAAAGADATTPTTSTAGAADNAVDALGAVTELRLARSSTSALPGARGRLRRTLTWEIVLQRQLAAGAPTLEIPSPAPNPAAANSRLTYVDPKGRSTFRPPEDLTPQHPLPAPQGDVA